MAFEKSLVGPDSTIRQVIKSINDSALQVALVVDKDRRLLGVVTDGDIRQGLLRNVGLDEPVVGIMNQSPTTARSGTGPADAIRIMQRKRLRHLPIVDGSKRVTDLLVLDQLQHPEPQSNWIVLMAGGRGTRLRPLTNSIPKPMIEVGAKPLLEHIILSFARQGFDKFYLSVNYLSSVIENHFGDGTSLGVKIVYLHEHTELGTAGALALLPELPTEPIIVMNADLLTNVQYRNILQFHAERGAAATICVTTHEQRVPFGVAELEGSRVLGLKEKPTYKYSANAGIYVLDPSVLSEIKPDLMLNMPDLLQNLIDKGRVVVAFPLGEYWLDIGHVAELERAKAEYSEIFERLAEGHPGATSAEE